MGDCGVGCVVVHTRDVMTDGPKRMELVSQAWEEMITLCCPDARAGESVGVSW